MHIVHVDLSHKQLHKLRKGGKIRIKKGKGFCLVVHPGNYSIITRSFGKNKGVDVALSPEEVSANQQLVNEIEQTTEGPGETVEPENVEPEQIEGKGIFGHHADRLLEKHGLKKAAYRIGDMAKPYVKHAVRAGIATGAAALASSNPEYAPYIPAGATMASNLATDYLDHPGRYQGKGLKSGLLSKPISNLQQQIAQGKASDIINHHMNTNLNYMGRAGLGNLNQESNNQATTSHLIGLRHQSQPIGHYYNAYGGPASIGHGIRHIREGGSIGRGSSMIQSQYIMPPAMQSQPHGANYMMKHFLPPQYQAYFDPVLDHDHNNKMGTGLYAGRGLGTGLYM